MVTQGAWSTARAKQGAEPSLIAPVSEWFPNHCGSVLLSCPVEKRLSFSFPPKLILHTTLGQRGHMLKAEERQVAWQSW